MPQVVCSYICDALEHDSCRCRLNGIFFGHENFVKNLHFGHLGQVWSIKTRNLMTINFNLAILMLRSIVTAAHKLVTSVVVSKDIDILERHVTAPKYIRTKYSWSIARIFSPIYHDCEESHCKKFVLCSSTCLLSQIHLAYFCIKVPLT